MAIMKARTSPSPPFSTEGLYSHSINKYNQREWVFWSTCGNNDGRCGKPHNLSAVAAADGAVIKYCLQLAMDTILWGDCLVQFWGLVKNGDKAYLTTCDQPFTLRCYYRKAAKKLCEYRKHCLEYLIPVDDDELIIGPPGRVFRSGLPEHAMNVGDYTSKEYPQRDYAVGRVGAYWALPIYHPTRHLPIGVLEVLSPRVFSVIPGHRVVEKLQVVNLTITCVNLLAKVNSCKRGEIAIIDEALSKVRKIRGLGYSGIKIWNIFGEILSSHSFDVDFIWKGQGVVGRAFSSKSACFCRDIKQLSITEYPLVPNARTRKYSACFAVCLQSSCSNNCIYVLEFLLPVYKKAHRDPRTLLHSLMETLKERLQNSFKIASGQELGQKLTVEVIKVSPGEEFDSFEICSTTGIESTPRLGEVHGGEGMMQLDFSSKQVDAANGSMNGIHEQQNGSVGSTPRLATAQGGVGMMQVDTANAYINGAHAQLSGIVGSPPRPEHEQGFVNISYQELNLAGVDVAHNSMNGIYEQQNGVVRSSTGQVLMQNMVSIADYEPIVEDPQRDGASIEQMDDKVTNASIEQRDNEVTNLKMQKPSCPLKSELGITRKVLEQNSARKLEDAAKNIGVSRSTLKRICREYGIHRWPPRKVGKVNQAFAEQKIVQPSTEDTHERHHESGAARLEDDNGMCVKAEYQGRMIKFRLPFSAPKIDLEENVVQRLNLARGSFIIEYQDEDDDRIWITCDGDLRTSMSTLSSLGRTTIKMYIVEDSPNGRDQ